MKTRRLARIAALSAGAVAVYVFESLLPVPIPFARIGLSNVFVVVALFGFNAREALLVNLVRVVAGSLLMGLMLSPAFLLSLAGSLSALGVMILMRRWAVPPFSVIGASAAGAGASNVVQIVLFTALFSGWPVAGRLLGGFILLGAGVGFITGLMAAAVLSKVVLERYGAVN
jgi:heptaprenyl diphosphate synthase